MAQSQIPLPDARRLARLQELPQRAVSLRYDKIFLVKICYVIDTTVGASWACEQLRDLRDKCGFEVTAIVSGNQGSLVDSLRSEGIPLHVCDLSFSSLAGSCILPFRILSLYRLFRREKFDVVQTHLFRSMIGGRIAAWLADVPVRLAMIAGPYHLEAHTLRWIDRFTCWMDTTLIASCEYTRQLYRQMGISDNRLATIYYGPDEKTFDPGKVTPANLRGEFGWPADTPLIGLVAYFYPPWRISGWTPRALYGRGIKGHEYLIKAAPIIFAEFPTAKILFVGSAFDESGQRYIDELKGLVQRLGLQDSIIFTGFRSDVNNVLRALDVSVQPSLNENLGGTIEALLMECALVATRVGGMVDSVKNGETGILVEPANHNDLADGILQLLRDPVRAQSLGRAGRKLMLERFTLSRTVHDLKQLYEKSLSQDGKTRQSYRLWVSLWRLIVLVPLALSLTLWMIIETLVLRVWDKVRRSC